MEHAATATAAEDACVPTLLHLSPALPSSLTRLNLAFSTAPSVTPATTAEATPSPSFRVRSIHFDDVSQDAVLVCEDCVVLFVPLQCDARSASSSSGTVKEQNNHPSSPHIPGSTSMFMQQESPPPQQQKREGNGHSAPVPAVAACLRLGNPHQAWSPPQSLSTLASTPQLSPPAAATSPPTSPSLPPPAAGNAVDNCLPRRLPLPPETLRRATSALVAVPVLAASSANAYTSTGGVSQSSLSRVMSIAIMECAVLPEGVDFIEPRAVPLARLLKRILCAPQTLRFREAWYPIQFFCWCGPQEVLGLYDKPNSLSDVLHGGTDWRSGAAVQGGGFRGDAQYNRDREKKGGIGEKAEASSHAGYTDYYLLSVSSICADLLRVRYQAALPHSQGFTQEGTGRCSYQPDVTAMMNSGYAVRTTQPPPPSKTSPSTKQRSTEDTEVLVTVVQRYVTRTDWCVYEARSRVLLSIHYTRPDVLKPIAVHYEPCSPKKDQEDMFGCAAVSRSASAVSVSLCKWTELTLPESICASLSLPSSTTTPALPKDATMARLLHSVVGVFAAYGHTFFYHVPAPIRANSRSPACMEVYLYLPDRSCAAVSSPSSSTPASPPPAVAASAGFGPGQIGSPVVEAHGNHQNNGKGGQGEVQYTSPPTTVSSFSAGFFTRLTIAASAASASAAPPQVCGGTFLKVARLSTQELLQPLSRQPSSSASPTGSSAGTASSLSTSCGGSGTVRGPSTPPSSPQQPLLLPPQLSLQVWKDFILLHNLNSGKSAVYDLAERSNGSEASEGALSSRDYVLWATASERSRRWIRFQHSQMTSASSSASSPNNLNPHVHTTGDVRLAGVAATSVPENNSAAHHSYNSSSPHWSRAAIGGWMSMMSAVANSVVRLPSSVEAITGPTATTSNAQVPLVFPLTCCTATVGIAANDDTDNTNTRNDNEGEGTSNDGGGGAHATTTEVSYLSYTWPSSSRTPLVIGQRDGSLRVCQVDVAALAEWLLLLRASQTSPSSHLGQNNGGATAAITSASLGQLIAFACRHPLLSLNSHDEEEDPKGDPVVTLLRELVAYLALDEQLSPLPRHRTDSTTQPARGTYCCGSSSYCVAVLQHHLNATVTESPGVLFAHLCALLESLTIETELVDRCSSLASQRMLAPVMTGSVGADTPKYTSFHHRDADDGSAATTTMRCSASLQALLLTHVWMPVWRELKYQRSFVDNGRGFELQQQQQRQQRRVQRCEKVLCGYVRLLHRLALPILPALQELLLEVVLRCDLDAGAITELESSFPTLDVCAGSVEALMASASGTARRVRELLRQGVLEENCTTARLLLGWWKRFRCQLSAAQREAANTDDAYRRSSFANTDEPTEEEEMNDAQREEQAALTQPDFLSDGGCPAAEVLFQEAVRLFTLYGRQLEVIEAYRWRRDYTAAAAVLLRVPRCTPPIELCGVHDARLSLTSSPSNTLDRFSISASMMAAAAAATLNSTKTTPHCASRLLSWDTLALAVLDGAWRSVRNAEEGYYVLAERAAAVTRSAASPTSIGSPPSPTPPNGVNARRISSAAPPTWQLRAAERAVQAAHRLYLSVARTILTTPGLMTEAAGVVTAVSVPAGPSSSSNATAAAAAVVDSTTEFHPMPTEAGGRRELHPSSRHSLHRYHSSSSGVSSGYHAHEVRYVQLRHQVETGWFRMRSENAL